jgi:glycosyltransferase involved in cell wall biosynthesis
MTEVTIINPSYSTTRTVTHQKPVTEKQAADKFETVLFLPEDESRQGEGGLRTQGYFKTSLEDKPLITVITVVFNGEKYLENTILSVINQTYDNVEYIIIDGGSTDGTIDIIKKYEERLDYWISESDDGIYDAMNKGVSLCSGDIIGLINADDWYEIEAILIIANKFITNSGAILHGSMNIIKENKFYYTAKPALNLSSLKKGMIINHPTVFVPSSLYKKYGFFSTDYKIASDWDLMLKFYCRGVNFLFIDIILANFRLGGASYSVNNLSIKEKHQIRIKNKVVGIIDKYYYIELLKSILFGKYLSRVSNFKQSIINKLK